MLIAIMKTQNSKILQKQKNMYLLMMAEATSANDFFQRFKCLILIQLDWYTNTASRMVQKHCYYNGINFLNLHWYRNTATMMV